ncbi:MAG TPA: 4Fe-4S dicluster domain-containing protein, partial [Blastocatellia bacterium]|nr:4Fe-4S dicluster domain-containing protein [Blastocatellia bacterium]
MKYGFIIDHRKCIGCHACTVACKSEHDVPVGTFRTWVKYIEKGAYPDARRFFSVLRCNHCEDAPCVTICPVTALFRRDNGIVDFDGDRCIGCKSCMQACPYDALYINPNTNTAEKCNYCAHRVEVGLEPACVIVCPEQAIISGDMDDPTTKISRLLASEETLVRKPEAQTRPKLYYIEADPSALKPTEQTHATGYLWAEQRMDPIMQNEQALA